MRWSEVPRRPTRSMLRQFAGLCLAASWLLAAWHGGVRGRVPLATAVALAGTGLGLAGLWRPEWLRPVFVGAVVAGFPLGWLVSRALLALVYFGLVTPLGWAFRRRKPAGPGASLWSERPTPTDPGRYLRQY